MSAIQELYHSYGVCPHKLSKYEKKLLEANLFISICKELIKIYQDINKDFFRLIKLTTKMENEMLESNFIRCIINDILSTGEYNARGIAFYSNITEDVIDEIASGINTCPSLSLSRKIIELHRSVRPTIYRDILAKIQIEQCEQANESTKNRFANIDYMVS